MSSEQLIKKSDPKQIVNPPGNGYLSIQPQPIRAYIYSFFTSNLNDLKSFVALKRTNKINYRHAVFEEEKIWKRQLGRCFFPGDEKRVSDYSTYRDKFNRLMILAHQGFEPEVKLFFQPVMDGSFDLNKSIDPSLINQKDNFDRTALHYAVKNNNLSLVKYLFEAGASLTKCFVFEIPDWRGHSTLYYISVIHYSILNNYYEMTKYLGNKSPKLVTMREWIVSPSELATVCGHIEILKLLLEIIKPINGNSVCITDMLRVAFLNGEVGLISFLVANYPELINHFNAQDIDTFHLLQQAILKRSNKNLATQYEINLELFLNKKSALNKPDKNGLTPLDCALKGLSSDQDLTLIKKLIKNDPHLTYLEENLIQLIQVLKNNNVDIYQSGPLIHTLKYRELDLLNSEHFLLHLAIKGGHSILVSFCLAQGFDFEKKDSEDKTPLQLALGYEHIFIIKLLINKYIEQKKTDVINKDELQKVFKTAVALGHLELVQWSLEQLKCFDIPDYTFLLKLRCIYINYPTVDIEINIGLLLKAAFEGHFKIVQLLIENNIHVHGSSLSEIDLKKIQEAYYTNINYHDRVQTALKTSGLCSQSYFSQIKCLASDQNITVATAIDANLLLHKAVETGDLSAATCFLQQGANINQQNLSGQTPLHLAIAEGHFEIANLLINRGANANIKNKKGVTAYEWLQRNTTNEQALAEAHLNQQIIKYFEWYFTQYSIEKSLWPFNLRLLFGFLSLYSAHSRHASIRTIMKHIGSVPIRILCNVLYANYQALEDKEGAYATILLNSMAVLLDKKPLQTQTSCDRNQNQTTIFPLFTKREKRKLAHQLEFLMRAKGYYFESIANNENIKKIFRLIDQKECSSGYKFYLELGLVQISRQDGFATDIDKIIKLALNPFEEIEKDINDNFTLHDAAKFGNFYKVDYCLLKNRDINAQDAQGNTPLHKAIEAENVRMIDYLEEHGANATLADRNDNIASTRICQLQVKNNLSVYLAKHPWKLSGNSLQSSLFNLSHLKHSRQVSVETILGCINKMSLKVLCNFLYMSYTMLKDKQGEYATALLNSLAFIFLEKTDLKLQCYKGKDGKEIWMYGLEKNKQKEFASQLQMHMHRSGFYSHMICHNEVIAREFEAIDALESSLKFKCANAENRQRYTQEIQKHVKNIDKKIKYMMNIRLGTCEKKEIAAEMNIKEVTWMLFSPQF